MATPRATAVQLLNQRRDEDWLKGWDARGKLRWQLSATGLATAANRAQAWLEQQDWSQLGCTAAGKGSPAAGPMEQGRASAGAERPAAIQPVVLLALSDPAQVLAWFSAISSLGYPLFLGDPAWGLDQWHQVEDGLVPDLIISDRKDAIAEPFHRTALPVDNSVCLWEKLDFPQMLVTCGKLIDPSEHQGLSDLKPHPRFPQGINHPWIGIPTGGSSGQLRFVLHRWDSLTASVSGLQQSQITGVDGVINSFCTLPLHHVSGLMQFLRSLLSGGQLGVVPWPLVKAQFGLAQGTGSTPTKDTDLSSSTAFFQRSQFFISLVPTQLQQLISAALSREWLAGFDTVFLGGAPAWSTLLKQAREANIRLAPTYGMTETASQIVTLHPEDFLRGQPGCGKLLPHAQINWVFTPDQGLTSISDYLPSENGSAPALGLLQVRARSLAWGYYSICAGTARTPAGRLELWSDPSETTERSLTTDDLGYCDDGGYIQIVGRASTKIISGGENVFPAAVEAAVLATGLVADVSVLGIADARWGERVVAVVVPRIEEIPADISADTASALAVAQSSLPLPERLSTAIAPLLSPAQRPKQWLLSQALPRNAQGKLLRPRLEAWVAQEVDGA